MFRLGSCKTMSDISEFRGSGLRSNGPEFVLVLDGPIPDKMILIIMDA